MCVSRIFVCLFLLGLVIFRGRPQHSGMSIQSHKSISSLGFDSFGVYFVQDLLISFGSVLALPLIITCR